MEWERSREKKNSKRKKFLIAFAGIILLSVFITGITFYQKVYAPTVRFHEEEPYLFIPTGSDYDDLLVMLQRQNAVSSIESFDWVARKMNLPSSVRAGRYRLQKGMSNYDLAALLRSGKQEAVKLVINKFRLKKDFASFISRRLEVDSLTFILALNDSVYLRQFKVKPAEAMALFIPNTYEINWNSTADQFMERMKREYDIFWNDARMQRLALQKLTPTEAIILASIVEEETNYNPEKPRIAGVYLNRLRKGMNLQADPTVKFALQNFALRRILNVHLNYDSPYNTYLNTGLPPGPICTPSIASIDAVLHAEGGDYLYFCADPDKPGTHAFAKTFQEHLLNARRYQKWLDQQ